MRPATGGSLRNVTGSVSIAVEIEARGVHRVLRLIQSPADDLAFERIVNQPKRGLGDKAVATIHQQARSGQEPLLIAGETARPVTGHRIITMLMGDALRIYPRTPIATELTDRDRLKTPPRPDGTPCG